MDSDTNKSLEMNHPPTRLERVFEILPGLTTWGFFILLLVTSFALPVWAAYLVIGFDLLWLGKSFGMSRRMIRGYSRMHRMSKYRWQDWLRILSDFSKSGKLPEKLLKSKESQWFMGVLRRHQHRYKDVLDPDDIYNAVIIAVVNEPLEVLMPTIESLISSEYDSKKLIVYIGYEGRAGQTTVDNMEYLLKKYRKYFHRMEAVCHPPGIEGETIGKGSNITYAAREMLKWIKSNKLDTSNVIVTTLDCDNRPQRKYFSYLTFLYCLVEDRKRKAFQPITVFFGNIWDVPAPMRIIAVGNTFWMIVLSMRPHLMRNFASHAQSLDALEETDFWSVRSFNEDGHQYWRSYFCFSGKYEVIPVYVPVYQDAVLSTSYLKTFKAQFIQIRRWAYGVTDIPYVVTQSLRHKEIPFLPKLSRFLRLFEGHFSWATAPLILALAGWLPLVLSPAAEQSIVTHQLPIIASRIQMVAMLGIIISITLTLLLLPPRPARYRKHKSLFMVLQWVLLPFTTIFFGAGAAINSQTRLMFKRYLEKFDLTEKVVKK